MPRSERAPAAGWTIVIPTHDTRELTLACLTRVREEAPQATVVVVDDGSRDGTSEAIAVDFPSALVLRNEEALGYTGAVNRALEGAAGEYVLLLNSDAVLLSGSLAAAADAFARDPRLGIIGAALENADGSPQWSGGRKPSALWLFALASGLPKRLGQSGLYRRLRPPGDWRREAVPGAEKTAPVDWVSGAAMAIRQPVLTALGPLPDVYRFFCQDLEYCLRAGVSGWRVALVPAFRVRHHLGASSIAELASDGGLAGEVDEDALRFSILLEDLVRFSGRDLGGPGPQQAQRALAAGLRLRGLLEVFLGPTPGFENAELDVIDLAWRLRTIAENGAATGS